MPFNELVKLKFILPFVLAVRGMSFYYFKTYSGIVRYTSTKDASRILKTIFAGSFAFAVSNILSWLFRINKRYLLKYKNYLPWELFSVDRAAHEIVVLGF